MDFFSGSATTADAVLQLNAEDGGTRKYIMVQIRENIQADTEAFKDGYTTICDIGKERIRRAARKIKAETGADIDYGFRVFRVDSNKEDRSGEDLLIQVMLDLGLELSLPMEACELEGKTVYKVAGNALVACFAEDVPESVMKQIAGEQPLRAVFRDRSFQDDAARINVDELFKLHSPSTEIQVL